MTTLRSYIDPDQYPATGPTFFKTERNEHEIRCAMCGRTGYVDEEIFSFVSESINAGFENPFTCEICEEEYDDLVYEG